MLTGAMRRRRGGAHVQQPIILLGAPRSGTTLLTDLLGAHPDVAVINEPRLVWRFGNDRCSDELRRHHARPEVIDHIHGAFGAVLDQTGRSRVVEKTPANSVRPRFVDAVFPDAVYVHITRNGWSAVPSLRAFWQGRSAGFDRRQAAKLGRRLREARPSQVPYYARELLRRASAGLGRHQPLYGARLAGLQEMVDELGHLEAAARQWRTSVEQAAVFGRSLPAGRYLEVQLESLDRERVRGLVAFCGLAPSSDVDRRVQEGFDPAAARRQTPLSDDEVLAVAPYVTAGNLLLGYGEGRP